LAGNEEFIRWFEDLDSDDVPGVGGKNASLGEMIGALKEEGVQVPDGFATTARAYRTFVDANEIEDRIRSLLSDWKDGEKSLPETGEGIRRLFRHGAFPEDIADAIRGAYGELSERYASTGPSRSGQSEADVAVRSSATSEDLPEASFAGQQETFLNVTGADDLLDACRKCYASLFTDRAITYREEQGFDHMDVALSVGVQKMVRADKACAGVMFTIDTDT
jgi:pyruvate,water dikinase